MNFVFVIISFPSNETAERICFFFYFVGRVCVCVFRSKTSKFFLKNVFETIREAKCKKKNKKIKNKTKRNQRLLAASFPAFKWKTKTINTGRVSFPSLPSFYRVFFGFFGHWGHRAAPVNERALRRPRNFQTKRNAKIQRFPDVIWCREMSHATVGRRFLLFLFDFFKIWNEQIGALQFDFCCFATNFRHVS